MGGDNTTKLAVLIDADNAQASKAGVLLAEIAKYGTAFVRRAYGDWTGPYLTNWKEALLGHSIQPIQQFAYTQGKNSTDSAMIIDAMDLLYSNRFDGFCLVSSDSDFTRLASRIRESGLVVYGFGDRKAPKPFVQACDKYIYVENLSPTPAELVVPLIRRNRSPSPSPNTRTATTTKTPTSTSTMVSTSAAAAAVATKIKIPKALIGMAIHDSSDDEGWANLAVVGGLIIKRQADFDTRSFGFEKLSDMIRSQPSLFEVEVRIPGAGKLPVVYARLKRPWKLMGSEQENAAIF